MTLNSGPHIIGLNRRIEELEDELQLARDRVKELEAALGIGDDLAPIRRMGFSPQEAAVVNVLVKRDTVNREAVMQAIYGADPERRYDVQDKLADVHLSRVRVKLGRMGVDLVSLGWLLGWRLTPPGKARFARLLASGAALSIGGPSDMRLAANRRQRPGKPPLRAAAG